MITVINLLFIINKQKTIMEKPDNQPRFNMYIKACIPLSIQPKRNTPNGWALKCFFTHSPYRRKKKIIIKYNRRREKQSKNKKKSLSLSKSKKISWES